MPPRLAVIVPTFNEAASVASLHAGLVRTLAGVDWRLIVVDDDSTDGTRGVVRGLMAQDSRVQLLHRIGRRGLSSACLEGMAALAADNYLVMDGDGQHPPEVAAQLLQWREKEQDELVIGSRFAAGAKTDGLTAGRERGSRLVNAVLRRLTGHSLTDPLSGCFLLSRDLYLELRYRVSGLGFKLLLDLLLSVRRPLRVREVPLEFRPRLAGTSKLDGTVVGEFLALLVEKLTRGRVPARFFMFLLVGSVGAVGHLAVMETLYGGLAWGFALAHVVATYSAIAVNYTLNNFLTYHDRRLRGWRWWRGGVIFALICSVGAANSLIVADALRERGLPWLIASLAGAAYGSAWNYLVSSILVWFRDPRRVT